MIDQDPIDAQFIGRQVKDWEDTYSDWRDEAKRSYDFVAGDQWDEADLSAMKDAKRPAVSLNLVASMVRGVCGLEVGNRQLYKSSIALNFVEPILYLSALGLGLGAFVKEINGIPYIKFIAPGIIASSSMFAAAYECTYGTYVRMTYQKTFDAILATPVNINELVSGELIWGATKSLLYGSIIMSVIALFGLVDSPWIILAIPFIFVSGLIFAELSVIVAARVPGIDSFTYFYTILLTPMFLFSGIFFPLDTAGCGRPRATS